jgi:hypothetical protein
MSINRTRNTRRWRKMGEGFVVRETWQNHGKAVSGYMIIRNGWALRYTPKEPLSGWYEPDEDGGLEWHNADTSDTKAKAKKA